MRFGNPNQPNNPNLNMPDNISTGAGSENPYGFGSQRIDGQLAIQSGRRANDGSAIAANGGDVGFPTFDLGRGWENFERTSPWPYTPPPTLSDVARRQFALISAQNNLNKYQASQHQKAMAALKRLQQLAAQRLEAMPESQGIHMWGY